MPDPLRLIQPTWSGREMGRVEQGAVSCDGSTEFDCFGWQSWWLDGGWSEAHPPITVGHAGSAALDTCV